MATEIIKLNIRTTSGQGAPEIQVTSTEIKVTSGGTSGDLGGVTKTTAHGPIVATEGVVIPNDGTGYVFVNQAGDKASVEVDASGANLPDGTWFYYGRAWKNDEGMWVVCSGSRTTGGIDYTFSGNNNMHAWIDKGRAQTWTAAGSPFQGSGKVTYTCRARVQGSGPAWIRVSGPNPQPEQQLASGRHVVAIIIAGDFDQLEYKVGPATELTLVVQEGFEPA
jgi:hypothetical protein